MYTRCTHIHVQRGVSAVEAVVGVSLLAVIVLFSMQAISQFIGLGREQIVRTQAIFLTEEVLELTRFIRDDDWAAFDTFTDSSDTFYLHISPTGPSLSTTATSTDAFTTAIRFYDVSRTSGSNDITTSGGSSDDETTYMVATTTWSGGSVTLAQYLANIHE